DCRRDPQGKWQDSVDYKRPPAWRPDQLSRRQHGLCRQGQRQQHGRHDHRRRQVECYSSREKLKRWREPTAINKRGIFMAKRRYSLRFDVAKEKWILRNEASEKVVKVFATKEAATRAGALRKVLGAQGGTVLVRKLNGVLEEERNFPSKY